MSTTEHDLISLDELRSVLSAYAGPDEPLRRPARQRLRARRPVLVAAVSVAALAVAGVAIAAGFGAFDGLAGIGAAQHPRTSSDVIDPAIARYMQEHLVGIKMDTARNIGQLPDGQTVYVVTGKLNDLCTVIGQPTSVPITLCGDPLTAAHPATITGDYAVTNDPPTQWVIYGLARDGVTSVSFQPTQADNQPSGPEVTVPVNHNLWIYRSDYAQEVDVFQPVKAHLADGTTVTEPATGTNCAAC